MKKITIGRGRECDIRLDDNTDKVSRRQAVITVSPTGKMMIYDTSSNGTYVNGEKVEKPAGKPIKRGDNINFAHLVDLDWDKVKNPYKRVWTMGGAFLAAVVVIAGVLFLFGDTIFQGEERQQEAANVTATTDSVAPVDNSLKLQVPAETPTPNSKVAKEPSRQQPAAKKANENEAKSAIEILNDNQDLTDDSDPALDKLMKEKGSRRNDSGKSGKKDFNDL